jgi:hypothetical protein
VTKVIRIISDTSLFLLAFALLAAPLSAAQAAAAAPPLASAVTSSVPPEHSAEALYAKLQSVGLDKSRVYNIREVTLERAAFHITFDDGIIAFTEDVAGHVTGAFFEGEGEVLLIPNDQAERASMMLFTGAAILEEKFVTAYFRFNDDTFAELQPALRATANSQEFVSQWDSTARNLAQFDALRLLLSFSNSLPTSGQPETASPASKGRADDDRMLHARLQGRNLGTFDLYFDSLAAEQIWAGQQKTVEGETYYDVWSAFTQGKPGGRSGDAAGVMGEEAKPEAVSVSQYKIQAKVAPPTRLDAEASLQVDVRQAGQRAVLFELSRFLQVSKVESDGVPVEFIHNQSLEGTQLARRAGPGIPTAGWRWPASICNFVIPRIGRYSRPASELTAPAPICRRVNNPAIGFLIVPCRLPDSIWANTCGWPPRPATFLWKRMPVPAWNAPSRKAHRRLWPPPLRFPFHCTGAPSRSLWPRHHLLPRVTRKQWQIRRRARSSSSPTALGPTPTPAWH